MKARGGLEWKEKSRSEGKIQGERGNVKTYAQALKNEIDKMVDVKRVVDEGEWQMVQRKKKVGKARMESSFTIFLYNIPGECKAREIWNCLRGSGVILDIILPRKRDKRGKIYGFVKTTSELEANTIILNVKVKGGLGSNIRMSLNEKRLVEIKEKEILGCTKIMWLGQIRLGIWMTIIILRRMWSK